MFGSESKELSFEQVKKPTSVSMNVVPRAQPSRFSFGQFGDQLEMISKYNKRNESPGCRCFTDIALLGDKPREEIIRGQGNAFRDLTWQCIQSCQTCVCEYQVQIFISTVVDKDDVSYDSNTKQATKIDREYVRNAGLQKIDRSLIDLFRQCESR